MKLGTLFLLSAMAAIAVSCGSDDEAKLSPTSDTTATATPVTSTATAPATIPNASPPPAGRSGLPSVDAAVDAMLATDIEALRAMIRFTATPCVVNPEGLGAPPTCREGEAAGTAVDVLPIAQCEGYFSRPHELNLDGLLLGLDGVPSVAIELYAVYRAPAGAFPPGKYFVIFSARASAADDTVRGFALTMTDTGITGIHYGCGQTPASMVEFQRLTDAVVAPQ